MDSRGPIKTANLEIFSEDDEVNNGIMVALGRQAFFDTKYVAIIVRNKTRLGQTPVTSSYTARSEGNLNAVEMILKNKWHQNIKSGSVIFKLSDMNIARALNRAAQGDESVKLAAPLNKKFQKIKKLFPKDNGKQKVLVHYDPHRMWPDKFYTNLDKLGTQRYEAAKHGTFQIHPSSHRDNLDAIELFYADGSGRRKDVTIRHESYLDYGVDEATMYARQTAAMNETYRLYPEVLAGADPHAFWSAILWIDKFMNTLNKLQLSSDLLDEWKAIQIGRRRSLEHFKNSMKSARFEPSMLKSPEDNWGITSNEDQHVKIATDYTICSIEAMHRSLKNVEGISSVVVLTDGQFKGTEMWRYIRATTMFKEMKESEEKKTCNEIPYDKCILLYRQCMEMLGFGRDSKYWESPAFLDLPKPSK